MDKVENGKNKIKKESRKQPIKNIKKEIKNNYKIGIEYYKDIEKHDNKQ